MNRSYTILYVDDDMDDLQLIADAFEKFTDHLTVIHAENGVKGLEKLQHMKVSGFLPCLAIIDINMPVMDGKEMLENMRRDPAYRNVPVIMFSTSNNPGDEIFAEALQADYVTKPKSFSDLESMVALFVTRCKYEEVS